MSDELPSGTDLWQRAEQVIVRETIGALASHGDGEVSVCNVFLVWLPGGRFGFKSRRQSAHMQNLARDASAALAIYDTRSTYESKRGVQLKGEVRPPGDVDEMHEVVSAYAARFPGSEKKLGSNEELLRPETPSTFFIFDVKTYRLVDESAEGNRTMAAMESWPPVQDIAPNA